MDDDACDSQTEMWGSSMRRLRRGVKLYMLAMGCATSFLLSAATFANYYSEAMVNGSAQVAKWEFDARLNGGSGEVVSFVLQDTAGVAAASKIAPGSKGSFTVLFKKGNSKTKQVYRIKTIRSSLPANLKFYIDSACTKELVDTMEFPDTSSTQTIFWKWNYTNVDENWWQEKSITATLVIQAYQKV